MSDKERNPRLEMAIEQTGFSHLRDKIEKIYDLLETFDSEGVSVFWKIESDEKYIQLMVGDYKMHIDIFDGIK